ncbi:MAG: hypothetical protein ACOYMD_14290 [Paludibacter sp.]
MKLIKSEINYLIQVFATFTFINITANMFGLWFSKLLNEAEFTYLDSIANEFVKPLAIQSALFGACFTLAYIFLKNRKLSNYSFVVFQFVIFHIIFILNLKIHHGIHFQSTFNNLGLQYLSNNGQYLIDVLYLYFPINGNFENGLFMPDNLGTFYIHWILLNLIYYFGLIWVSIKATKLLFEDKVLK